MRKQGQIKNRARGKEKGTVCTVPHKDTKVPPRMQMEMLKHLRKIVKTGCVDGIKLIFV